MNALFGIPMNTIMLVLIGMLAVCLASVGYVVLRNRIMFFIGLRNIPRRVAQTTLIVVGLMLSTLIISAAFTTGDTVDYSITNQTVTLLGHVDEVVQFRSQQDGDGASVGSDATIPQGMADQLRELLADDPNIDGVLPVVFEPVPVVNADTGLSSPEAHLAGVDTGSADGFPDFISVSGGQVDISALPEGSVYVNESLADETDLQPGDGVQVFVQGKPVEFRVADVLEDRALSGALGFEEFDGLVTALPTVQRILGREGEVDFVAISNRGGVRDGVGLTDAVVADAEAMFKREGLDLEVLPLKRDNIDQAEEAGNFMATFFLIFGLFSIASGVLLIVMIFVMLAAERKPELGMARAIGTKRSHLIQTFMSEGMVYNVAAAAVGAALGILISFGITRIMARIFSEFNFNIQPYVTLRSIVISYALGVVLTFFTVTFASWRVSKLNIVRAIRDIPEPTGGRMGWRMLTFALVMIVLGTLLMWSGMAGDVAFAFALGFSMIILGVAIILRFFGFPDRPVFTAMGILLLLLWGLTAGNRLEFLFGPLEGDIEMFFLSGISMVTASTFVLVYNADVFLAALGRVGDRFGRILPAVRTAVAYPLAAKFRTGMTLAMISLIVFALVVMSTMNLNFDRIFLSDEARGGWDVLVEENPNNPLGGDLAGTLEGAGFEGVDRFRAVGRLSLPGRFTFPEVREGTEGDFDEYFVYGVDPGFVDGGEIGLEARAKGFESDEAVWRQIRESDGVALIDAFTLGGFGPDFGTSFSLKGIAEGEDVFDPVTLEVRDPVSGNTGQVRVIGVISLASSATFTGVFLPERTFTSLFGQADSSRYYVGLKEPGAAVDVAKQMESAVETTGAQASSIKKNIDDDQALFRNFFRLMQAFMGLGLFVGIAAVGVISFRSVVERRQQIGMLRAIGYTRGTVALSFLLESTFVAALGIASGIALAVWLSYFLVTSDEFPTSDSSYAVPWSQIAFISGFAFFASLVMTIIPSRQAAGVPIAEALRYE
jgi:putative ABC transport system permease protein